MLIIRSAAALAAVVTVALPIAARDRMSEAGARRSFSEPAYSPDRREIAFVSGGDIWTVPAGGGEAHLIVTDASNDHRPLYSPDGSQLAFMSNRNGGTNVYVCLPGNATVWMFDGYCGTPGTAACDTTLPVCPAVGTSTAGAPCAPALTRCLGGNKLFVCASR